MAETTNLESLQDDLARQHVVAVKTQALHRVLQVFAPEMLQHPVDYLTLLDRVRTVLDEALASATAPPVTE